MVLASLGTSSLLVAQEVAPAAAPLPALVDLPAGVRSAGLAGLAVALPGDAAVVFDNPSAIGPIRRLSIEAAYARLPDDRWYTTGAAAIRQGRLSLAGGYRYLRFPREAAQHHNLQWAAAISGRVQGVHVGMAANYLSVEDSSGAVFRTLTEDVGLTVAFFDIAALALVFENIGRTPLTGPRIELPARTRLGFALNLIDTYSNGRLLAAIETIWTADNDRRTLVGLEGGVVFHGVGLVARIGHGGQVPGRDIGKTSYGASVVLGRARIDYAHQSRSAIGRGVHLVGIHWTP